MKKLSKKMTALLVAPVALSVFLSGCGSQNEKVASVGSENITESDVLDYVLEYSSSSVVKSVIENKILDKEMKELKIDFSKKQQEEAIEKAIESYGGKEAFNQMISSYGYTEEEANTMLLQNAKVEAVVTANMDTSDKTLKAYFDENKDNFSSNEQTEAYHILVTKEDEATKIIKELDDADDKLATFKKLAKSESTDTGSATEGGYLDKFSYEDMVEEFSEAAWKLKDNTYSKTPVKSEYGYHIIYKVKTYPAKDAVFKDVKDKVKEEYIQNNLASDYEKWIKEKMIEYKVNDLYNDIDYAKKYKEEQDSSSTEIEDASKEANEAVNGETSTEK